MTGSLRVLSWNVWKMFGDPLAVHRVLRAAEPDLVCLQEAPVLPGSSRRLAALARAAGLRVVVGGRSAAGNAMLCSPRMEIDQAEAIRFQPLNRWIQRRGAVLATVGLGGGPRFQVAGVHLGLDATERRMHVADLIARLTSGGPAVAGDRAVVPSGLPVVPAGLAVVPSGLPVVPSGLPVVAGDLNELAGGPSWQALAPLVSDPAPQGPPTFSVARPRRRIDVILTGAGIETLEYGQWQPDPRDARLASDHLPVLSVIRPR